MYRIFEKKKGPIDVPGSLILRPMFAAHPYNHFCTEYPPPGVRAVEELKSKRSLLFGKQMTVPFHRTLELTAAYDGAISEVGLKSRILKSINDVTYIHQQLRSRFLLAQPLKQTERGRCAAKKNRVGKKRRKKKEKEKEEETKTGLWRVQIGWAISFAALTFPGGGDSLSEVTGMCLLQVKSRGLSGKMCTLQNMGSFSKQPEAIPYQVQ